MDDQFAIAIIRELGEEARNLSGILGEAITAFEGTKFSDEERALRATRAKMLMEVNTAEMYDRLNELKEQLRASAGLREAYGDIETRLHNLWDRALREWVARAPDVSSFKATQEQLDSMTLESLYVSIPARLDHNLQRGYRIGGALEFYNEFGDEGSKGQLETVLAWLRAHAATVRGIVDVDRGVI